ncbi:MAG: hypothetical protein IJH78_08535 [Clostridia bacterium]|nr:hypothetical protein [Clostridia bacterium]
MAVRHTERPIQGAQFRPGSILAPYGRKILKNFIEIR